MNSTHALFGVTLALFFSASVFAAEADYANGAIKTQNGFLLVLNKNKHSFTLEITGHEVRSTSLEDMYFAVDKQFLQVTISSIDDLCKELKISPKADTELLEAHRDWEAAYFSQGFGSKVVTRSQAETLANGWPALFYEFDIPANAGGNVRKHLYLTACSKGYIICLGGVSKSSEDEKPVKDLLLRTMITLKEYSSPISLSKMRSTLIAKREGRENQLIEPTATVTPSPTVQSPEQP